MICLIKNTLKQTIETAAMLKRELMLKLRKDKKQFFNRRIKRQDKSNTTNNHIRYIIWDIETTQEPDENGYRAHKPNLVVAYEIIIKHGYIKDVETFVDALEPHVFEGENCIEDYCQWVIAEESNIKQRKVAKGYDKTICIAHNSRGYDSRFVLKYLDSKSLIPQTIRANGGSSIQYISVKQNRIIWIDSLNFFNEPLSKLTKTYGIKNSAKGYFPHGFNSKNNENYIGPIPALMYYHPEYTKIINHKGKFGFY